jgi:hypothetical protein
MAPDILLTASNTEARGIYLPMVASAWETQASGRHGRFALKSAPRHRDFRAGKVGDSK